MKTNFVNVTLSARLLLASAICLSGCASHPIVNADWTTYPRDHVRRTTSNLIPKTNILSSLINSEISVETLGDEAQISGYIVPQSKREFSESALFGRVAEYGKAQCGGDYRVVATRFFVGTEKTLDFSDIKTPALDVTYRCALNLVIPKANLNATALERISMNLPDAKFFDISSKRYLVPKNRLIQTVRRVAVEEGMPIAREGRDQSDEFLIAGLDPNQLRWGRIEKLAAVVGDDGGGSVLTFRLFAYQLTYHNTGGTSVSRGAQPWDRKTAYLRALDFLTKIDVALARSP